MMRSLLADLPLKRKITTIVMISVMGALIVAGVALGFLEQRTQKQVLLEGLATDAEIMCANAGASLLFHDARSAEELLDTLRVKPAIRAAAFYDRHGMSVATFARESSYGRALPRPASYGLQFEGETARLSSPVVHDGDVVGSLVMEADLSSLREHTQHMIVTLVLTLLVAAALALLLSSSLRQLVVVPILTLLEAAKRISRTGDYALRVPPRKR